MSQPEPLKGKIHKNRICLDCGQAVSDSAYPYHNADHTFQIDEIAYKKDIESAVIWLKQALKVILENNLNIEQRIKVNRFINEAFHDVTKED